MRFLCDVCLSWRGWWWWCKMGSPKTLDYKKMVTDPLYCLPLFLFPLCLLLLYNEVVVSSIWCQSGWGNWPRAHQGGQICLALLFRTSPIIWKGDRAASGGGVQCGWKVAARCWHTKLCVPCSTPPYPSANLLPSGVAGNAAPLTMLE